MCMAYRGDDPAPLLPASARGSAQGWLWKVLGFLRARRLRGAEREPAYLVGRRSEPQPRHQRLPPATCWARPAPSSPTSSCRCWAWPACSCCCRRCSGRLQLLTSPSRRRPARQARAGAAGRAVPRRRALLAALGRRPGRCITATAACSATWASACWRACSRHVNADRSAAAAGLFYFAAGLMVLMSSLGLTQQRPQADLPDRARGRGLESHGRLVARAAAAVVASCSRPPPPAARRHPMPLREPPVAARAASAPVDVEPAATHRDPTTRRDEIAAERRSRGLRPFDRADRPSTESTRDRRALRARRRQPRARPRREPEPPPAQPAPTCAASRPTPAALRSRGDAAAAARRSAC